MVYGSEAQVEKILKSAIFFVFIHAWSLCAYSEEATAGNQLAQKLYADMTLHTGSLHSMNPIIIFAALRLMIERDYS